MKTIKENFHRQLVKVYRQNIFTAKRKQLLFISEMKNYYNKIIQNNLDMMLIILDYGYANFYKYFCEIVDDRLVMYVLFSQSNLLKNLQFFQSLICLDFLCQISISRFFNLVSNILKDYIQNNKLVKIIQNIKCLLKKQIYYKTAITYIKSQRTMDKLFDSVIQNQKSHLFYNLIQIQRLTGDFECMSINKLVHCIQVHLLTSADKHQLYQTYKFLGQIFDLIYNPQDELRQYGSIINKMFSDFQVDYLKQSISFFLTKGIKNCSILNFLIQMNLVVNISSLIIDIYPQGDNCKISIFSQQSIWRIFKILLQQSSKVNEQKIILNQIDWLKIKIIIKNILASKILYIKIQVLLLLEQVSKINELKQYFQEFRIKVKEEMLFNFGTSLKCLSLSDNNQYTQ